MVTNFKESFDGNLSVGHEETNEEGEDDNENEFFDDEEMVDVEEREEEEGLNEVCLVIQYSNFVCSFSCINVSDFSIRTFNFSLSVEIFKKKCK